MRLAGLVVVAIGLTPISVLPALAQENPCNPDLSTCVLLNVQTDNPVLTGQVGLKYWVGPSVFCQPVDPKGCAEAAAQYPLIGGVPFHGPVQEYQIDGLAIECQKNAALGFGCTAAQHQALGK